MIPLKHLSKVGTYSIDIDGVKVTAKVADSIAAVNDFLTTGSKTGVVGIDYKKLVQIAQTSTTSSSGLLVLCWVPLYASEHRCLVIHLQYLKNSYPNSSESLLNKFLKETDICYVNASAMPSSTNWINYGSAIEAGDLSAQILHKPNLKGSSLATIASEVGVCFDDLKASSTKEPSVIQIDQKYERVLTPEQVKNVIIDAYACYKIGTKLLFKN